MQSVSMGSRKVKPSYLRQAICGPSQWPTKRKSVQAISGPPSRQTANRRHPTWPLHYRGVRTIRRGQFGVGQFGATICCGQFGAKYNINFIENPALFTNIFRESGLYFS